MKNKTLLGAMTTHDAEDLVRKMIEHIGEDPNRSGIQETPSRVVRSWGEIFHGYNISIPSIFKTFDDVVNPEGPCGIVYLKNIEFFSTCEHHMLPFYGTASIAYIPEDKVIGVSKLARLLDAFARRMQVQERIGDQVVNALMEHLKPKGAACLIEAKHLCMVCRGVQKQHSVMGYSAMRGAFLDDHRTRAEFIALVKG